jgi:hypothetical protein
MEILWPAKDREKDLQSMRFSNTLKWMTLNTFTNFKKVVGNSIEEEKNKEV